MKQTIARPGLILSLCDHFYFNDYVVKEIMQQKYKTGSYNLHEVGRIQIALQEQKPHSTPLSFCMPISLVYKS